MKLLTLVTIFCFITISCQTKRNSSLSKGVKFNNSNNFKFDDYLIANKTDSIYLEVLQGVGSGKLKYISWTYGSTLDSFLFVLERAKHELKFKPIFARYNVDRLAVNLQHNVD